MIGDHHRRSAGRATLLVRAADGILGTHRAPPDNSPLFYGSRISVTTTAEQVRALQQARLSDGIPSAARIRALIALWMDDPRLRAGVDRVARDWQ